MKRTIKLLFLILLLCLGGCRYEYNYIVITPKKMETGNQETMHHYQKIDRWSNTGIEVIKAIKTIEDERI